MLNGIEKENFFFCFFIYNFREENTSYYIRYNYNLIVVIEMLTFQQKKIKTQLKRKTLYTIQSSHSRLKRMTSLTDICQSFKFPFSSKIHVSFLFTYIFFLLFSFYSVLKSPEYERDLKS